MSSSALKNATHIDNPQTSAPDKMRDLLLFMTTSYIAFNIIQHYYIKVNISYLFGVRKSPGPSVLGFFVTLVLVRDVWHKGHEACALDGASEVALLLGTEASTLATIHASVWVDMMAK